eukprot:6200857-Pleurochrysis_carterae.AAC.1
MAVQKRSLRLYIEILIFTCDLYDPRKVVEKEGLNIKPAPVVVVVVNSTLFRGCRPKVSLGTQYW